MQILASKELQLSASAAILSIKLITNFSLDQIWSIAINAWLYLSVMDCIQHDVRIKTMQMHKALDTNSLNMEYVVLYFSIDGNLSCGKNIWQLSIQ